jgi:hypothetical protein
VQTGIISLNNIKELIFFNLNCCVFLEVQTKFLNIIETSFGFEALIWQWILVIATEKDKKERPNI